MSLSDCPHCWDTPCTCGYMYWFMDQRRLEEVVAAATRALGDRRGGRRPPGSVREELERRAAARGSLKAADFDRRIEVPWTRADEAAAEEAGRVGREVGAAVRASIDAELTAALEAAAGGKR